MSPTIGAMPEGHQQTFPQAFPPPDPSATRQIPAVPPTVVEEPGPSRRRSPWFVALEILGVFLLFLFGIGFIESAFRGDTPRRAEEPSTPGVAQAPLTGSTIVVVDDPYAAAQRIAEAFLALLATDQFDVASIETGNVQSADTLDRWYGGDDTLAPAIVSIDQIGRNRYRMRAVFVAADERAAGDLPEVRCGRFDVDPTTELLQAYEPVVLTDSSLQVADPLARAQQLCAQAHLG